MAYCSIIRRINSHFSKKINPLIRLDPSNITQIFLTEKAYNDVVAMQENNFSAELGAKKPMKCHGCSTLMVLDKQETGSGSRMQWHSCPLCRKVRLTSEPDTNANADLRAENGRSSSLSSTNVTGSRKGTPYFA